MNCVNCDRADVTLHLVVCEKPEDARSGYRGGSFCDETCLAAYIATHRGTVDGEHGLLSKDSGGNA